MKQIKNTEKKNIENTEKKDINNTEKKDIENTEKKKIKNTEKKKIKIIGKRIISLSMFFLLTIIAVTGCSKDGKVVSDLKDKENGSGKTKAMGRYIEKDIEFPEDEKWDTIIDLYKGRDGSINLFTNDSSGTAMVYYNYTWKDENEWEKKECKWLDDLKLDPQKTDLTFALGEDGKQYAFYRIVEDQDTIGITHILFSEDGIKAEEIKIPELAEKDAYGYYPLIRGMAVLDDGSLVLYDSSKATVYNPETGKAMWDFPSESGKIVCSGNIIYHYDTQTNCIDSYDGKSGQKLKSTPITLKESYEAQLQIKEDTMLAVYSKEGIQQLKEGSDLWEIMVPESAGTLGSPRYYCKSFIIGDQDDYFVYYNSMNDDKKLSHYLFDKDTPTEADTTLTVYALRDNPLIAQAASEFQALNPNIRIDFQVAAGDTALAAADEDYIRTLNTELLAGKGPDILILDGLPEKSFIEKGVLKDISSIINPMVSTGGYLSNIAEAYTVDGKIYSVPSKIGIPIAIGGEQVTSIAGDLEKLAEYISQNPEKTVFGTVDRNTLLSFYLDVYTGELLQTDGSLNTAQMKIFLEAMKKIFDHTELADADKEIRPSTVWSLIEEGNLLYVENMKGFIQSTYCFSVAKQIKVSYSGVKESFVPIGKIGINNAGKNQEAAEQFVKLVLSSDSQKTDYYDGFPVNTKVLENYKNIENTSASSYGGTIQGFDGKTYELKSEWPSLDQRQEMIGICKTVSREAYLDRKLMEMIIEKSADYFNGSRQLEETIENIAQTVKAYLNE